METACNLLQDHLQVQYWSDVTNQHAGDWCNSQKSKPKIKRGMKKKNANDPAADFPYWLQDFKENLKETELHVSDSEIRDAKCQYFPSDKKLVREKFWHRFSWDQSEIWISTIPGTSSKSMGRFWIREVKISLCRESEFRNLLFQKDHARDFKEIEELRRICCEEVDQARQARIEELSMQQERNPMTVSQLMALIQFWSNPRSQSNFFYSESQNLAALWF